MFFPPLYQGANDAAKVLGVKLNYIPIDEADIEASSARTMQAAIAQHPDVIVCLVLHHLVRRPADQAGRRGRHPGVRRPIRPRPWRDDGAFGYVGQDSTEVGSRAAERLNANGAKDMLFVINVPGNPYFQRIPIGLSGKTKALVIASVNLELPRLT